MKAFLYPIPVHAPSNLRRMRVAMTGFADGRTFRERRYISAAMTAENEADCTLADVTRILSSGLADLRRWAASIEAWAEDPMEAQLQAQDDAQMVVPRLH